MSVNNQETEEQRLKRTIDMIKKQINSSNESVESLYRNFNPKAGEARVLNNLVQMYNNKEKNLRRAIEKPYFARIDFMEDNAQKEKIYIGKCSVINDNNEVLVADWRAPISSLYYDGRIGKISYTAPEGEIKGELLLKRLYEIENGKLISFSDIDITSNDELLRPYLSVTSDVRLKNIISTIQSEQNKIIRAKLSTPLIVQGVAGSGKTTVALHRIAYLIYEHANNLKPENFLIIAPNKFFLDYISDTLPDLGVDDVSQLTFEDFAQKIIGEKLKIENSNNKLADIINNSKEKDSIEQRVAKFKSSMQYREILDRYLENIEEEYLQDKDLRVGSIVILSNEKLKEKFKMTQTYTDNSLENKFKIFMNRLEFFLEQNMNDIENMIKQKRTQEINNLESNEENYQEKRREIFNKYDELFELLKKNGKKLLANYSKSIKNKSVLNYYKDFVVKIYKYTDENIDNEVIKHIQKKLLSEKNKKQVEYEDLAPLIHIKNTMTRKKNINDNEIKHIIIDEAQDYSVFQFFALNETLKNNSMTVLGDIAQGIYSYRGISNWEDINKNVFDGNANILELGKSYRTTMEIMEKGNDVLDKIKEHITVKLGEPVIRKGEKIRTEKKDNYDDIISSITKRVSELKKQKKKNIAIITKTLQEAKKTSKSLENKNISNMLVSDKTIEYNGGIIVVPAYLSKGLEFDSVILFDVNKERYKNNELDAKLLYVAITRAMHTLDIYYIGEKTELLKEREKLKEDGKARSKENSEIKLEI